MYNLSQTNANRGMNRTDECYYYSHGYCHYGADCWFRHTDRRTVEQKEADAKRAERQREIARNQQRARERERTEKRRLQNLNFNDRLKEMDTLEQNGDTHFENKRFSSSISCYKRCLLLLLNPSYGGNYAPMDNNKNQRKQSDIIISRIFTKLSHSNIKCNTLLPSNSAKYILCHLSALNLCQMAIWLDHNNKDAYVLKAYILYHLGLEYLADKSLKEAEQIFGKGIINKLCDYSHASCPVPERYFCQLCGMVNDHWIMQCPLKNVQLNREAKDRINSYEILLAIAHSQSYPQSPTVSRYMDRNFDMDMGTDDQLYIFFALFNLYAKSRFNIQQMVQQMVFVFEEDDDNEIRALALSIFIVLLFQKPNEGEVAQFAFDFMNYCNEHLGNDNYLKGKSYFDQVFAAKSNRYGSDDGLYDDENTVLNKMEENNKHFWLFAVGEMYWNQLIQNMTEINQNLSHHFLGIELLKVTSLSDHQTYGWNVTDATLYRNKKKEEFTNWSNMVWAVLKNQCLVLCREIYEVMLTFCQSAEANIYSVRVLGIEYYNSPEILHNAEVPKILHENHIAFGDIVDILGPEQPEGPQMFFADIDHQDYSKLKLIQMDRNTDHYVSIPLSITTKLCDPLNFYHFFSPFTGLEYQYDVEVSFHNNFILQILGIYDPQNVDCKNYDLYSSWSFWIVLQKDNIQTQHWMQNTFCVKCVQELSVRFCDGDIPSLDLSQFLCYRSADALPSIYFVEKYYFKQMEIKSIKKNLQIKSNATEIYLLDAYCIDKNINFGKNVCKLRYEKPISWSLGLSFEFYDYVGLNAKEMEQFVHDNQSILRLCYRIIINGINKSKPKQSKFTKSFRFGWNAPYLLEYMFEIISPHKSCQQVHSKRNTQHGKENQIYCSVEIDKKDLGLAILNGFKTLYCHTLEWKFVKPFATKKQFNVIQSANCIPERCVYAKERCTTLVQYLLQINQSGKHPGYW
eukprot:986216_1